MSQNQPGLPFFHYVGISTLRYDEDYGGVPSEPWNSTEQGPSAALDVG